MNYIDIILLAIVIIYMAIGFFKGFAFSIIGLFSSGVRFIICFLICKPVTLFVNSIIKLDSAITSRLTTKLTNTNALFDVSMQSMTQEQINNHIGTCVEATNYPKIFKSYLNNSISITEGSSNFTFNEIFSRAVGIFFSYIIVFIILFILFTLLVWLLKSKIAKIRENSTSIKKVDRYLGIVYGIVNALINIAVVFFVLFLLKDISFLKGFFDSIYTSFFGKLITDLLFPFLDKYINLKHIWEWIIELIKK